MWDEAREIGIFAPTLKIASDLMQEHGIGRTRINQIINRRLVRLRQRGLHQHLKIAGVPELLLTFDRAPEYVGFYEMSKQLLPSERVDEIWFG